MKFFKEKFNYYGFIHEKVYEKFEGDLEYINTFCVLGEYAPSAIYYNKNPNRDKNHKDYMLLSIRYNIDESKTTIIRGLDKNEIEKFRYQTGLWCLNCDEVIYSVNRHSCVECGCKSISIDGGKDYIRISSSKNFEYKTVKIDLLTDKIIELEKKNKNN